MIWAIDASWGEKLYTRGGESEPDCPVFAIIPRERPLGRPTADRRGQRVARAVRNRIRRLDNGLQDFPVAFFT